MARYPLILVTLSPEQSAKAKEINGKRKQITRYADMSNSLFTTDKTMRGEI